ncbi:MAG TPA: hypothetical protein VGA99_13305, partial [bacterium]
MTGKNKNSPKILSKGKRIGFTLVVCVLPVFVLFLVEFGLRLANYGGDLELFVRQRSSSSDDKYVLNANVTKRYFFQKGIKTPSPNSQIFSATKDSSTYRIFCLGASTTQGFPYPPSASYPAMLQKVLSTVNSSKNFEVINCGITAITSHSVLDMSREILADYEPDLLVLYTGHNEFYGALGQASRLSLFQNRAMVRLFLELHDSRLFLLLRDVAVKFFGARLTRDSVIDHSTFMGTVARDVNIPRDGSLFRRTRDHFRDNLFEIIEEAGKHSTPVVVSTLVSSLDFEPFGSLHSGSFVDADTARWQQTINEAGELQMSGQFQEAAESYSQTLGMDSCYAPVHYQLAKCYQNLGRAELALQHFVLARDFDPVRFRAPSAFNDVIREAGEKYDIPVVDSEEEFAKASPGGLVGQNLILEHVHPNQLGYLRIAKAMARKMSEHRILADGWDWTKDQSDSAYLSMSRLTALDREVVNYRIFRLTSHWPFHTAGDERPYARVGNERTEEIARALVADEDGSLVKAHLDLGLEFYDNNDLDGALAEYLAALEIEPACETFNRIGLLFARKAETASRRTRDYAAAAANFREALSFYEQGLESCPGYV